MANDAHDSNITTKSGVLCKMCYDILTSTSECKCKNIAIIIDDDGHTNLYVDDIHTAQQATVYIHTATDSEIHRELLAPFSEAIYVNYALVKHSPLNFKPYALKNDYKRKTKTKYNTKLMYALTRYEHKTSDGQEEFLRTSLNDPLKDAK